MAYKRFGFMFGVLAALTFVMVLSTGATSASAQSTTPTPTATPFVTGGKILLAQLSATGVTDPTNTVRTAIQQLKGYKLTVTAAGKAFKTADDATAAAKGGGFIAVVWVEPGSSGNPAILHFMPLQRQALESHIPAFRENTTVTGVVSLPDDLQLPLDPKLDAKTIGFYTQTEMYLSLADYTNAGTSLAAASDALAANPALGTSGTNPNAVTYELNFEQAYLDSLLGSANAARTEFADLSKADGLRPALQAMAYADLGGLLINTQTNSGVSAAGDAISSALAIDSNQPTALINQGTLNYLQNDNSGATDSFDQVLSQEPTNIFALNDRGWVHYASGDYPEGLADVTAALKIDPLFIDAYIDQAVLLRAQGDYGDAILAVSHAVTLDPNFYLPLAIRGNLYVRVGEYRLALADLNRAIDLDARDWASYDNRAYVEEILGDLDKALVDYSRAVDLNPSSPFPYVDRGELYLKRNDYYNAVIDESLAIQFDRRHQAPIAFFYRAQAYRGLQRWSEALADYQKYIDADPQGFYVQAARAYINAVTALLTPTPTDTPEPSDTPVPTDTNTPTDTLTFTPLPTNTPLPTSTPTNTPKPTATDTPKPTSTNTPKPTATNTPKPSATNTPKPSATSTPMITGT